MRSGVFGEYVRSAVAVCRGGARHESTSHVPQEVLIEPVDNPVDHRLWIGDLLHIVIPFWQARSGNHQTVVITASTVSRTSTAPQRGRFQGIPRRRLSRGARRYRDSHGTDQTASLAASSRVDVGPPGGEAGIRAPRATRGEA